MKKDEYDVIIIGAGIGGLVCGCYLAKFGFKVLIIEQNEKPGGYCTSFNKNGFKFDIGVHYLGSCREAKGMIYQVLNDLSLLGRLELINNDPYDKIITPNETIFISKDITKTQQALIDYFPKEKESIKLFFNFIINENLLSISSKTKKITFAQFLDSFFNNYRLKSILSIPLGNLGLPSSEASALVAIMLYREYVLDGGYYPKGGMQKFPDLLALRFQELGGELRLSTRVISIKRFNKEKFVIESECKKFFLADFAVSNISASNTFKSLLSCKSIERQRVMKLKASASAFVLYLGISKNLEKIIDRHLSTWLFSTYNIERCYDTNKYYNLNKDLKNKRKIDYIVCHFPSLIDPDLAPTGKSSVRVMFWVNYSDKVSWDSSKERLSDKAISMLDKIIPNVKESIEFKKIATPYDFHCLTSNENGAIFGWSSLVNQANRNIFPFKTSRKGLYLTGSWVTSDFGQCGIPIVAFSGKNTAESIRRHSTL
jgi:phytoene dehydrogenase-like protein